MKPSPQPEMERPLSPLRQACLMLVVIVPMAACYPAIDVGLAFAPPLRFAGARTLLGGLMLVLVLVIRRKPLWPEARLARWILPLGLLATTLTFGAMFASPAYTGAGIASVLGNTQPLIIIVLAALFLGEQIGWAKALALLLGLAGVARLARTNRPFFSRRNAGTGLFGQRGGVQRDCQKASPRKGPHIADGLATDCRKHSAARFVGCV